MLQPSRKRSKTRKVARPDARWFTPAVLGLSLVTAIGSAGLAASLTWPAIPSPFGLAAHHEKRANLALDTNKSTPLTLERAGLENELTLAAAPATATAWLRAAYIRQQQQSGVLDAESLRYIETSYRVSPLGPGASPWRVLFVFENWNLVTPAIRAAAMTEVRSFAAHDNNAHALVNTITNPAGRMAARLAIRTPPKAPAP
ncbi:hypothetical protein GCM10017620_00640 [Brevundimonas intermedia]|uniref:Uncharacterized protein n=1 Tax=Brevundimonas intermedia TaxID=74315 RepID=A0ABQ5T3I1_9CAUL|nr:hypothetical protein [Brevundimonas intermedia]GLK47091.1 hypothetical protein GCM10017620_00640 [Brevundimonas intermedia]